MRDLKVGDSVKVLDKTTLVTSQKKNIGKVFKVTKVVRKMRFSIDDGYTGFIYWRDELELCEPTINKNWRYYKRTVALLNKDVAGEFLKEALKNGFDLTDIIGQIVFGASSVDMTPVISVMPTGNYWGRKWMHEKVYGKSSVEYFSKLPKYMINVDGLSVEVSKESFDAFNKAIELDEEKRRKEAIWKPKLVEAGRTLKGMKERAGQGYLPFGAEFAFAGAKGFAYAKKTSIAGVRPLTLHRYTEEFAKKFGDDMKLTHCSGDGYYKKYIHVAYHRKGKKWVVTYSNYIIPFTTMFGSKAKAEECLKWLRDIEVI